MAAGDQPSSDCNIPLCLFRTASAQIPQLGRGCPRPTLSSSTANLSGRHALRLRVAALEIDQQRLKPIRRRDRIRRAVGACSRCHLLACRSWPAWSRAERLRGRAGDQVIAMARDVAVPAAFIARRHRAGFFVLVTTQTRSRAFVAERAGGRSQPTEHGRTGRTSKPRTRPRVTLTASPSALTPPSSS